MASAAAPAALTPAKARLGGQVSVIADHSLELLLHRSGLIEALVFDASGKPVSEGVSLSVSATSQAQAKERVALSFVPARARFEGHAKAGVELAPGPVEVSLAVSGKPVEAKLAAAVVVTGPDFGGSLLALGEHSAELVVRANGEVLAFLRDAAGALVQTEAGLELSANLRAAGGASENVALHFDSTRKCFAGHAKAGVELVPGPVELSLTARGNVAVGALEQIALRVDAAHGGEVVVVGDYSVELVAKGKELQAFVFDAAGKASAAADLDLRLALGAGAGTALALRWDPPSASYRADLGGKLDFDTQPIRVMIQTGGRLFVGAAASLQGIVNARIAPSKLSADAKLDANAKLAADAKLDAKAKLDAAAKLAADAKLKAAEVKALAAKSASAAAQVKVTPPKVTVQKSASASAGAGSAKAAAGFSFGTK